MYCWFSKFVSLLHTQTHTHTHTHAHTQFNHCKWRGHVLKVELAQPDYKLRLHSEWAAQAEAAEAAAAHDYVSEFAPAPMDVSEPLHITAPSHSRRRLKVCVCVCVSARVHARGRTNLKC